MEMDVLVWGTGRLELDAPVVECELAVGLEAADGSGEADVGTQVAAQVAELLWGEDAQETQVESVGVDVERYGKSHAGCGHGYRAVDAELAGIGVVQGGVYLGDALGNGR